MTTFTPVEGLIGGLLIGAASALWLWLYGRVTGISGFVGGLVLDRMPGERAWRAAFLLGLIGGAGLYTLLGHHGLPGTHFKVELSLGWPGMILAGLLVGYGTRMGNGCTSGHGVCGMARLSKRSFAATATFMAFGFLSTFVMRHLLGLS